MATTRLQLYNGALLICGERALASITEAREPRRLLDGVWADGGVRACLEQGQWFFAMRTQKIGYDTAISPAFGYARAFAKPSDWVNTTGVWQDEFMRVPLLQYTDEAGYLFASLDEIYWRYVSDGDDYGNNFALWPYSFTEFVKAYFASKIIHKLTDDKQRIDAIMKPRTGTLAEALLKAKSASAMAEPTKIPPTGSWNRARQGSGRNRDGGNTGSLIG